MADYTFATVMIVSGEVVDSLREQLGADQFNVPLAATPEGPATHWGGSGPYGNHELEAIVNVLPDRQVYFGTDWEEAFRKAGLVRVMVSDAQE